MMARWFLTQRMEAFIGLTSQGGARRMRTAGAVGATFLYSRSISVEPAHSCSRVVSVSKPLLP